jgi:hypothetical protein
MTSRSGGSSRSATTARPSKHRPHDTERARFLVRAGKARTLARLEFSTAMVRATATFTTNWRRKMEATEQRSPGAPDNHRHYDEFAGHYDDRRARGYHKLIDDQAAALVRRVGAGKAVLEVGCGTD